VEVVAAALGTEGGEVFDLEVAGLFKIVVVSDKVGALLGVSGGREGENRKDKKEESEKRDTRTMQRGVSLQVICN
jgi:hypothetical protein